MQMSQIRGFRMTALAEGSSFLLLLFVAMPMKYLMGMPKVVTVVGAIHGILFLLYVAQLAKLRTKHQWGHRFHSMPFLRLFFRLDHSCLINAFARKKP